MNSYFFLSLFIQLRVLWGAELAGGGCRVCLIKSSFADGKQSVGVRIQATSVDTGW